MLHQSRKLVLAGAVAALALGTFTSAADAARWRKAAPIRGDSNRTPDKAQVGISDEGSAVVAWTEFPTVGNQTVPSRGRVRIAMRRSGKKFEKPLKMPEVGARLLDVSVGPDGTAAVLYNLVDAECNFLCDSPLRLAVRDAGGKFREPITVVDSAFGGQVEVDGKGVINVMWTTPEATDPRGLVAQRKPRGSFDEPVEVPGIGSIEGPTLAVNDRGDAIAAWVQTGRNPTVLGAYRKAGRGWSRARELGTSFDLKAAIADNGDAVVAWAINGETRASYANSRTRLFTTSEVVPADAGTLLDLAIDGDGNVLAMAARQTSGQATFTNIVMTRSVLTRTWREQAGVLTGREQADFAFDGLGTAYALFTEWVTAADDPGRVSVAMQPRGDDIGRATTLSKRTSWNGVIDVSAEGNAIAAWVENPMPGRVVAAIRE